jgi:hypothetical protein
MRVKSCVLMPILNEAESLPETLASLLPNAPTCISTCYRQHRRADALDMAATPISASAVTAP